MTQKRSRRHREPESKTVPETTDSLSDEQKKAEEAARELHQAMAGLGTNENELIRIILGHSNKELQLIKNHYLLLFKQNLETRLESNLSGKFRDVMLALLKERSVFEAVNFNMAISSIGENEKYICELLCTKSATEIASLKEGYLKAYKRDLVADIENVKDGDYNDLYLSLAKGNRKSNHGYDIEESRMLAQKLADASTGNYVEEKVFIDVLGETSFAQLLSVFACFADITGKDIKDVVEPRSKGNLQKLILTMIRCVRNRPRYFAEQIHYALSGIGTRDSWLIYYIVSRCEIDMTEIKAEYLKLYDETLYRDVKRDASGSYEKVLLHLIGTD